MTSFLSSGGPHRASCLHSMPRSGVPPDLTRKSISRIKGSRMYLREAQLPFVALKMGGLSVRRKGSERTKFSETLRFASPHTGRIPANWLPRKFDYSWATLILIVSPSLIWSSFCCVIVKYTVQSCSTSHSHIFCALYSLPSLSLVFGLSLSRYPEAVTCW